MVDYEIVIGLEVHAQLLTTTKLFCSCRSRFGDPPNTHGCPVCLGLPGALPVMNRRAVEMAVRMGNAIGCKIATKSIFARKNYFYPDLPKGYQISQYDMPLCIGGSLPIIVNEEEKVIGITRIHLEEDAGKLIHDQGPGSLFDVNRCGTPLIEIVSEPDMRSPAEAHAYLLSLKQILEYLEICDCNMEEGSLRCDANISIRHKGEKKLGTKTEIKNMNSFKELEKALEYEAQRQAEVLESGNSVLQQTFLWDPSSGRSIPMRSKEDAHDYRYFPEPDLMPLVVEQSWTDSLKQTLPELPSHRRTRFEKEMGLAPSAAEVLTSSRALADYFEQTLLTYSDARQVANWIMGDILRIVKDQKLEINCLKVTSERLGKILKLVENNTISARSAKKVINLVQVQDKEPEKIIDEQGLGQISDSGALETAVKTVLEQNSDAVERYKKGEKKLIGFFVGQAMRATQGKGNPKEINSLIARMLG
ncbi:MAG TPA: Asp-tRNA(Asn)/Glu-tRNA(Gln) amidotransferase subunit GatB [Chitinispirillaceae bacterium]|nr:Asp-tRNA(Asn)/Glu-tRNA(Gln) amidotransferase subunit GatB [Chitinispirillaceae bacterium]